MRGFRRIPFIRIKKEPETIEPQYNRHRKSLHQSTETAHRLMPYPRPLKGISSLKSIGAPAALPVDGCPPAGCCPLKTGPEGCCGCPQPPCCCGEDVWERPPSICIAPFTLTTTSVNLADIAEMPQTFNIQVEVFRFGSRSVLADIIVSPWIKTGMTEKLLP